MHLALRFDDPSEISDRALEQAIVAILRKYGLCVTLAVIPFCTVDGALMPLSPASAAPLTEWQQAGTVEIAQHGHSHAQLASTAGAPSEFAGVEEGRQSELLGAGLQHLRALFGETITGFVPPYNSYDAATLRALRLSGLRYLSAGWDTPARGDTELAVIPRTCQMADLEAVVQTAHSAGRLEPVVVAVMHHYDFRESGSDRARLDLTEFDRLMAWLAAQADIRVHTLDSLAEQIGAAGCRRALRLNQLRQRLPRRLQSRIPQHCLITAPWWRVLSHALHDPRFSS